MYNASSLLTVKDCNASLEMANRDLATYDYRITTISYRRNNSNRSSADAQEDTVMVQSEIDSLNNTIAALPDGPAKEAQITKLMRKQLQMRTLGGKNAAATAVEALDQDLELSRLNLSRGETLAFVDAVTARKTELEALA